MEKRITKVNLKGKEVKKMSKTIFKFLMIVFAITLFVSSANAIVLQTPITEFKFTGDTAFWHSVGGDTYYNQGAGTWVGPPGGPTYPFIAPAAGDTIFSIGQLTGTQAIGGANVNAILQPEELTYMTWGNRLSFISAPDLLGYQSFAFVGDPALLAGAQAAGYPVGLPAPAYIAVFRETNGIVDTDPAVALGPAGVVGINDFPGITDLLHTGATPWITGYFIPATVGVIPGVTLSGNINFTGAGGAPPTGAEGAILMLATIPDFNGGGFWTGSANSLFTTGYFGIDPATGLPIDATLANTVQRPFNVAPANALNAGWFNNDNDPVRAAPTPEPSTIILIAFGIIGVGSYARLKNRKR